VGQMGRSAATPAAWSAARASAESEAAGRLADGRRRAEPSHVLCALLLLSYTDLVGIGAALCGHDSYEH